MIIKKADIELFNEVTKNKRIFCFAGGKLPQRIFGMYKEFQIEERIVNYVDNNEKLFNSQAELNGKRITIISPAEMREKITKNDIVLIGTFRFKEVIEQLDGYEELEEVPCYILKFLMEDFENNPIEKPDFAGDKRIPKKLHYFWFGGNPMGELELRCLESWYKFCPDYEIVCWNEKNYDFSNNRYAREAYEMRKYAFVTDYARLDVIYNEGGIYFDTDVEIIKSIDELLSLKGFMGFDTNSLINTGVGMGGIPGLELYRILRDAYDTLPFALNDGKYNDLPNSYIQAKDLKPYGLRFNNKYQVIDEISFFPAEFFSPISYLSGINHRTENTYSIHHFSGTWQDAESTKYRMLQQKNIKDVLRRIRNGGYAEKMF